MTEVVGHMTEVVVYARPGCHLCQDAMAVIERVRAEIAFALVEVDIEADEELHRRYLERIPVVCVDGAERFEYFVSEEEFRQLVGNLSRPAREPGSA